MEAIIMHRGYAKRCQANQTKEGYHVRFFGDWSGHDTFSDVEFQSALVEVLPGKTDIKMLTVSKFIISNNLLDKWGTGSEAVSNEVVEVQFNYIKRKFMISDSQLNDAIAMARQEA